MEISTPASPVPMHAQPLRPARPAFTLIELLVVVAIIALLISILLPSMSRARETSKRVMCAQRLKGVANGCKVYSFDNRGWWPTVPNDHRMPNTTVEVYTSMGGTDGLPRDRESANVDTAAGREVSPSRALWLLVRHGALPAAGFNCPSSEDFVDDTPDTLNYYDFKGYGYLSYGYQVPFFERLNSARPREDVDPRMVLLADKNPGFKRSDVEAVESIANPLPNSVIAYNSAIDNDPLYIQKCPSPMSVDLPAEAFVPMNSVNHGGSGAGEGQNVARADASVRFERIPCVGIDGDNIYSPIRRGNNPWVQRSGCGGPFGVSGYTVPGEGALGGQRSASTDTTLFP